MIVAGFGVPTVTMHDDNDDVRDWFEQGELGACPRCGHDDVARTSIGGLFCLGCGELVDVPGERPSPSD